MCICVCVYVCVCACARACVCVRACVCADNENAEVLGQFFSSVFTVEPDGDIPHIPTINSPGALGLNSYPTRI